MKVEQCTNPKGRVIGWRLTHDGESCLMFADHGGGMNGIRAGHKFIQALGEQLEYKTVMDSTETAKGKP